MNPAIGKYGEMNEKSGNLLMRKSTNSRANRKLVRDTMNMPTDRFSIPTIDETSDDQKSEILDDLSITISTEHVASISGVLSKRSILWACDSLERLQIKLTLTNIGIFTVALTTFMPRTLTYVIIYPFYRLVFGTLYPAYASYKAVRTKNVKEYVKWMMYWIVFALFTCAETFTDVFFSFWFPFYYEIKVILVLWLLSPATKGSSILYRRFVHPALSRREAEIDEALARATEQGYTAVLHLGTRGVNYATTVLMQTAIKGGGGLVQQLKKSYSLSDLTGEKEDENRNNPDAPDESDFVEPRRRERVGRRGYSPRRTQSSSNRVEMYFSEVDVDVRQPRSREPVASLTNIRSSDDISSGYSSGEALQSHRNASQTDTLVRTSSVGARTRAKPRTTTKKSPEDEMDSDRHELPSLDIIPFPPALSFLTAEQALHLLSIFSQGENNNSKYIQNEPKSKSSSPETSVEDSFADSLSEFPDQSERVTKGLEKTGTVDVCKITGEICQEKFSELKELLNSAHRAVTNIVSSQEKLDGISGYEKKLSSDPGTRNVTRSNSDCGLRAGKYHKKPAPKVPITRSRDNIEDVHAPEASALKATLVIKTGTVKTFSNVNNTKDVFLAHAPVSKKKKFHKKSKEGFTKLLTIPKTLLHNALHKEQNDEPESSDSTLSRSRSASTGSRELRVPEESSNLEENVHESPGVLEKGDELESAKENTEYRVDGNERSGDKRDSRMWIREMSRSPTRRIVEPKKERADD